MKIIKRSNAGKTLVIDIDFKDNVITDICISGDYFAYPETLIEELEEKLKGKTLTEALKIIDTYKDKITLLGITLEDIKQATKDAYDNLR